MKKFRYFLKSLRKSRSAQPIRPVRIPRASDLFRSPYVMEARLKGRIAEAADY